MEHFAYSSGTSGEIAVNPGSLARADLGVPCFAARRSMSWFGCKLPSPLRGMLRGRPHLMRDHHHIDAAKHGTRNPWTRP
jgi:hypothetical protein